MRFGIYTKSGVATISKNTNQPSAPSATIYTIPLRPTISFDHLIQEILDFLVLEQHYTHQRQTYDSKQDRCFSSGTGMSQKPISAGDESVLRAYFRQLYSPPSR